MDGIFREFFDINEDGVLDENERILERIFDINEDGVIDDGERILEQIVMPEDEAEGEAGQQDAGGAEE